jgi:hypothetical protein
VLSLARQPPSAPARLDTSTSDIIIVSSSSSTMVSLLLAVTDTYRMSGGSMVSRQ